MSTIDLFRNTEDFESFAAGQIIFKEGDMGSVMYVVKEGQVDIVLRDKVLETLVPGGVLGEMALIDLNPRSASAVAKTDCKLVPVDKKRFIFLVQISPQFALQVMRVLAQRLRYMDSII